jgi:hypothetical protein
VKQVFEPGESAALAMSLAGLFRATETDESLAAGFDGRETGADAVFGVQGYVAFDLSGKVCG